MARPPQKPLSNGELPLRPPWKVALYVLMIGLGALIVVGGVMGAVVGDASHDPGGAGEKVGYYGGMGLFIVSGIAYMVQLSRVGDQLSRVRKAEWERKQAARDALK